MSTIQLITTYTPVTCTCGFQFALPSLYRDKLRNEGGDFYCPKCATRLYYAELENTKLSRKVAYLESRLDQERASVRELSKSLTATRGVVTRIKNRVSKGVCPCCKRTFADLASHMKTKHPKFSGATP